MALTYIVIRKNTEGRIIARGKGSNINEAMDNMQNAFEDYTIEEAIRVLSEELKE